MGTHIMDISGSLLKKRLDKEGNIISETSMLEVI